MFHRLKDRVSRYKHSLYCYGVFNTPPVVKTTDKPVAVLTQLQHKDVILFLIALKSFASNIKINRVFIVNDGSLTTNDCELIKKHIPISSIYHFKEFANSSCPPGGCWERL